MIKKLTIHLTGPICLCDEENLAWQYDNGQGEFKVSCKTCKAVTFPKSELKAGYKLDREYPGAKDMPKQPRLTPLDGGKGKDIA